jgi:multidrug efflux pump subunit AcrB
MQLVLAGDDPDKLNAAAAAVERDLRKLKGLGSVSSSASLLRPEIQIIPDPARAADLGVATADIAEAARVATAGDYTQRMAKLNLPDRQIPIRVGVDRESLSDPALIGQLRVRGKSGPVPLSVKRSMSSAKAGTWKASARAAVAPSLRREEDFTAPPSEVDRSWTFTGSWRPSRGWGYGPRCPARCPS